MDKYRIFKYHALGNDYIVIDPRSFAGKITPAIAKGMCDRGTGMGADGVLLFAREKRVKNFVRIFNSDGSQANKSGNGTRIFARYLFDMGFEKGKNFSINTGAGEIKISVLDKFGYLIKADIGRFSFLTSDVPVAGKPREIINEKKIFGGKEFRITCVGLGIPHTSVLCNKISLELAKQYGASIERDKMFPHKTNVNFLKVIGKNKLQIEIWERGSGYTLASGSSACAALCCANKLGLCGNKAEVKMAGGSVFVEIKDKNIFLTGPITKVFEGEVSREWLKKY